MPTELNPLLGTLPLSDTFLESSRTGLWAIEIDEGKEPRMYVDDKMLHLLGLENRVSAEATYNAWHDNIDPKYLDIVNSAVGKMTDGAHAEAQYPWHHPDGHIVTVRCGGMRNPDYKNGLRIEGVHQDVSGMIHYDDSRRVADLINAHMTTATGAFTVNLETDVYTRVRKNTDIEYRVPFPSSGSFSGIMEAYIESFVHPEDAEAIRRLSTTSSIKALLTDNEEVSESFRKVENGTNTWFNMVVTRLSDNEVLVYFDKKHEELIKQFFNDSINSNIISGFILDLDTLEVWEVKESPALDLPRNGGHYYSEQVIEASLRLMDEEHRDKWREFTSKEHLMKIVSEGRHAEFSFSSQARGKKIWLTATFTPLLNMNSRTSQIALTINAFSQERTANEAATAQISSQKKILEHRLSIIEALASEHTSVYDIDLINNKYEVYYTDEDNPANMENLNTGTDYYEGFLQFTETVVHPADRDMVKKAGSIANLKEVLKDKKTYAVTYRYMHKGKPKYSEMKFVKLDPEDHEPTRLVLGFADNDDDVLRKFVDDKLYGDYEAMYFVSMNEDLIRVVKGSQAYTGNSVEGYGCYTREINRYAINGPREGFKDQWYLFANLGYMKEYLRDEDKREYVFKSFSDAWKRVTFQVCERDPEGNPLSFVMYFIVLDTYEAQKVEQLERQNRELEESYLAIKGISSQYAGLAFVNTETGQYKVFKSFKEIVKEDVHEFYRKNPTNQLAFANLVQTCCHPDDRKVMMMFCDMEAVKNILKRKRRHAERVRILCNDNEYHWYNYIIIKLDEDRFDPLTEFASAFVQVDDEVRREEAYRKALDEVRLAQEASRLKTMFVQNISHDIRTPLNAIVGFSQLLALPGDLVSDEEKDQYSEYIKDSTDLLTMIINDVLSMSDVEKGILNVAKAPVSCNEICRKSVNCSATRTPQGVKMYYTSEVGDDYMMNTDLMRAQQILVNLLSNACKHTEEGEIHVHCSISENPGYVTFSVTDTGEGIKEEMANNIFERFITMDSLQDGHGMGLNICKDLSERLGGFVRLDRTYTGGARFVLVLPADEPVPVNKVDLQKLTDELSGLWKFERDEFYVIGANRPSWTNDESGLDSLEIRPDKTLRFNVHLSDGQTISTPGYYTVSEDDGTFFYRLWDGNRIIECSQRHLKIEDGKLIIRVEKENFDNHMKQLPQGNNFPCDYCLTILERMEA